MKKNRRIWACIAAVTVIFTSQAVVLADEEAKPAAAEASKPTAALDMGVLSQYIWRGFEQSYNSVVIQPSMTVGYEGFSFNVWGNMDTDLHTSGSDESQSKYTETDLTLSYAKTLGMFKLSGGYIYYALALATYDSQEVYASVGLDTILSPTLTVYREIAHSPAWYFNLGVSHSQPIYEKITLDLAASAGYYYSDTDNMVEVNNPNDKYREFNNGLLSAGLTIPVGEYFAVKPMVAYSFPLCQNAADYIDSVSISDNSRFFYGGVTLSMAF